MHNRCRRAKRWVRAAFTLCGQGLAQACAGGDVVELKKLKGRRAEHYHYMADAMRRLEWDLHHTIEATSRVPEEWHEIAARRHPKVKVRMTVGIDEDVVRFFKSMGPGHGPRMNEVLRSFMHARLAGVVRGGETAPWYARSLDQHAGPRPMWGALVHALEGGEASAEAVEAEARVLMEEALRLGRLEEGP